MVRSNWSTRNIPSKLIVEISTVVSEWLGGFDGLGVYMIQSKKLFQYDTIFAIIVLISTISLLGMFLVDQLERTILKRLY